MKKTLIILIGIIQLIMTGCSVQSSIRKGIETAYEATVDERSLSHIIEDKKLSSLIMASLIKDDVTNLLDITAVCYFGYPFVVGQCSTPEEAQRAIDIAQEVTGKTVVPHLVKKGMGEDCNPALDLVITKEVTARLVADKKIFASNVVVKSIQCEVVLLGVLGSKEYILAAIDHAGKAVGVKSVKSFLVSTDTERSWDSVFKAMGDMAKGKDNGPLTEGAKTAGKDASPPADPGVSPPPASAPEEPAKNPPSPKAETPADPSTSAGYVSP